MLVWLVPVSGQGWMEFVPIPAGEYLMGCPRWAVCEKDVLPQHRARIRRGFEMGKYEVTQAQWESVMGENPSFFRGADHPVEQITWDDVQEFLARVNARGDGYRYRLPTEAEWEYAVRAGSEGEHGGMRLEESAWFDAGGRVLTESTGSTRPVGLKKPNAWGLHDMLGNVAEWVSDWHDAQYYRASPLDDPKGPAEGRYHVARGGSWYSNASYLRVWDRYETVQVLRRRDMGFRVAREREP